MQWQGKKTAFLALSVTLGLILSYVEALIPVFAGVPGMKPGLSNILIVFLLFRYGIAEAATVNLLRILIAGILFGNPFSIVYSLSGAVFAIIGMALLKRTGMFSVYGVSMAGGMLHNAGQILVAAFIVENYNIVLYLPVLIVSGCITGFIVGFIGGVIIKRVR
ncbi:MAG: Gx transporter family protein [Lachnospiraceae bacterium]|nr:Gx transporter family protein [Lachnospiraceae bacterium]